MAAFPKNGKKPKASFKPQNNGKNPKALFEPTVDKTPKIPILNNRPLSWRFSSVAKNGPYSWLSLSDASTYKKVMEHLINFETMSMEDIIGSGSHKVAKDSLSKEAQKDLLALQHDDIDELMSFRITGAGRVWAAFTSISCIFYGGIHFTKRVPPLKNRNVIIFLRS